MGHGLVRNVGQRPSQMATKAQVPEARPLDEGPPDGMDQAMADEQVPKAVGSLVEVGHGQICGGRGESVGPATPD